MRKFQKQKLQLYLYRQYFGLDLEDMQLKNKFNKGFKFLLSVINIYSKYKWVFPLKDKKSTTIFNTFQTILVYSSRKSVIYW